MTVSATTFMVIVRSTIELAHNLGLQVVAEGIEDEKSLARLRAMGCDEAQGFFMKCVVIVTSARSARQKSRWLRSFLMQLKM